MRYYEGHEAVYQRLQSKGCLAWDEFLGQAAGFDSFCMRQFIEETLARSEFASNRPRALEIGCGTGPLCCFLTKKGFEVEGIDISATAIGMAKEQAEARGLDIKYFVGDVCQDVLPEGRYDLIVDGHCMHCIVTNEDRLRSFNNIRAALRPGGRFWIDTMLADAATDFGKNFMLDEEDILWVKIPANGKFDLEKQVTGMTYVANRRVYRDSKYIESELQTAGFVVTWSNIIPPEKKGQSATYQAICTS